MEAASVQGDMAPAATTTDTASTIAEHLKEIDQGQGIMDIRVTDDGALYLVTAPDPERFPSVLGNTERALYQKVDGFCQDDCLNTWAPYTTKKSFTGNRLRTVRINETTQQHYVLLDGSMLFTYLDDFSPADINGDGFNGEWKLARP
jgi:hypothetical protein